MSFVTPIVCLLLGLSDPAASDAIPVTPADANYRVIAVPSGVEIVVKNGGEPPLSVRLLGIDTPRVAGDAQEVRKSQKLCLDHLVPPGSRVRLVFWASPNVVQKGHGFAHVYRLSDDLWINRVMVEQGYATASAEHGTKEKLEFEAAEKKAKEARIGMWAADFKPERLSHLDPPRKKSKPRTRPSAGPLSEGGSSPFTMPAVPNIGAAAPMLINGGFELPAIPGGSDFRQLSAGDRSLQGWSILDGSLDLVRSWQPAEASQSLDLNGSPGTAVIRQTFATTPGTMYRLSFSFGNNPESPDLIPTAIVQVMGAGSSKLLLSRTIFHRGSTYSNMDYTRFSDTFAADSVLTSLQFQSTISGNIGVVIDAVTVDRVDQPTVMVEFRRAQDMPGDGYAKRPIAGTGETVYVQERDGWPLSPEDVAKAYPEQDEQSKPAVGIRFTERGADRLGRLTENQVGKRLAVLVGGKLIYSPDIRSKLTETALISNLSRGEADRLIQVLNSK